jgi:hypothetical protein
MQLKYFKTPLIGTTLILALPLIAMQFTDEVDWSLLDFIVMGLMLFSLGVAYEVLKAKINNKYTFYILMAIIFIIATLFWAELAVGIFGTAIAGS